MAPRVIVIGAGATGLSAAAAAARLGADVTVLERDYPASGSSALSLGIFNRQTPDPHELELRILSVAELERLEVTAGLPLDRCGYLRLARRETDMTMLARTLEVQAALGYDQARLLDGEEVGRLVPDLNIDDVYGALYGPTDGTFDGHLVCDAYLREAESRGAKLRVRTQLEDADLADEIVLHTSQGVVNCDVVINAAGAWAERVGSILGVDCPLVPQRHSVCDGRIERPMAQPLPIINEYMPGSGEVGLVIRPEGADRFLAMLHSHEVIDTTPADTETFSRAVEFDYVERVAERIALRLPGLADDLSLEAGWSGLYPVSADQRFQVGPAPGDPRIVVAAGVGGVGITVSGAVGRLAAEWAVLGKPELVDFADELRPGRPTLRRDVSRKTVKRPGGQG